MNKTVKIILIVAAILLPVGVIITIFGMLSGGGEGWGLDVSGGEAKVITKNVEESVDLAEFDSLMVETSSADVIVMRGDSYKIEYTTREGREPIIEEEGGKLTVKQAPMGLVLFDFNFGSVGNKYVIYVPDNGKTIDLDVVTSSGDIMLDRINASGSVVVSSGDVVLNDIKGESINVQTSSGDINIDKGEYKGVDFKATSGDVNLLRVMSDTISCKTSSGDIDIYDSETDELSCDATSGEVTVQLNGDPEEYSYDVHVSSGDIVVNGIETDGKEFSKDAAGDKSVNAHASSGDIDITIK